jgi:hypothetical protein
MLIEEAQRQLQRQLQLLPRVPGLSVPLKRARGPGDGGEAGIHGQHGRARRAAPWNRARQLGDARSRRLAVPHPEGGAGQDRALVRMDHPGHAGDRLACIFAGRCQIPGEK